MAVKPNPAATPLPMNPLELATFGPVIPVIVIHRVQDAVPLARALVAAAPDRIVWGTDWPHPGARALMPEDHVLADLLAQWVTDEGQRRKVLVDNPARLYGF